MQNVCLRASLSLSLGLAASVYHSMKYIQIILIHTIHSLAPSNSSPIPLPQGADGSAVEGLLAAFHVKKKGAAAAPKWT